jgi:hypothetical protein
MEKKQTNSALFRPRSKTIPGRKSGQPKPCPLCYTGMWWDEEQEIWRCPNESMHEANRRKRERDGQGHAPRAQTA